jgi:hypothetical protein
MELNQRGPVEAADALCESVDCERAAVAVTSVSGEANDMAPDQQWCCEAAFAATCMLRRVIACATDARLLRLCVTAGVIMVETEMEYSLVKRSTPRGF